MISVHVEATHIHRALQMIKNAGKKVGVVINPGTPVESLLPVLEIVDYVLVMTVNPGFGGQSFIEACAAKVKILRDLRQSLNLNFNIEVDGGINNETIKICVDNGADMFVTGSYFFKQEDYGKVTQLLKGDIIMRINLLCSDRHLPSDVLATLKQDHWGGIDRGALILINHSINPVFQLEISIQFQRKNVFN